MDEKAIEELKKKRDKAIAVQDEKWQREIDLLERRTETNIEDIELEEGGTIAVYSSLDQENKLKIADLFDGIKGMGSPENWGKEELINADENMYEVFEIMTPNPYFTKDWFKTNPKQFSQDDIERLILRARVVRVAGEVKEQQRIASIKSFRTKSGGPKLR